MWHTDQILASNLPVPLKEFIANLLQQLPIEIPDSTKIGGWGPFLEAHRAQKQFGQFLKVKLPDQDIAAFLRQQIKEYNPPCREIIRQKDCQDYRYLERYYLFANEVFSLDAHRFLDSDIDPFHDHPWPWSLSFLLVNICYEGFLQAKTSYRYQEHLKTPGTVSLQTNDDFHRIRLLDRTQSQKGEIWTFFLHCRQRQGGFGFLEPALGKTYWFDGKEKSFLRYVITDPGNDNRTSYPSMRQGNFRAHDLWAKNSESFS